MPTTYAHYRFGRDVAKLLGESERALIEKYEDIYNFGVYGPDILFYYYYPFGKKIRKLGSRNHHEPFAKILRYSVSRVRQGVKSREASIAYMYGFICHFALDSYCHGFVNYTKHNEQIGHNLQEAEFDRYLMEIDKHNPAKYKPASVLRPSKGVAEVISEIYPEVDEKTVYRCICLIKSISNYLVATNPVKRALIYASMLVTGRFSKMSGMVIRVKPDNHCNKTNDELHRLYKKAVEAAAELIMNFQYVLEGKDFPPIYDFTFSTNESVEKKLDEVLYG